DLERAVELAPGPARPAIRARDRRLQSIAESRLVAGKAVELVVADRCRRAEERLARDAGQVGQDLVGARRVGDRLAVRLEPDGALRAPERLLEAALVDAVEVLLLELEARRRPPRRRPPRLPRSALRGRG